MREERDLTSFYLDFFDGYIFGRAVRAVTFHIGDGRDNVRVLAVAKDRVTAVQVWGGCIGDEELASVGVRA